MVRLPFTATEALAYVTLPRIIPRLQKIGFQFSFVAYLMASLYAMVKLLPPTHPYLSPSRIGTYSIRQVFIEAARNLKFDRQHIDQLIMFFFLLAAFVLLLIQFVLLFVFLFIGIAHATVMPYTGMFSTPDPTNDIAMVLLDRVFGLPGMFNSCISTAAPCDPTSAYLTPYEPATFPEAHHRALHSLFGFFSIGLGLIGIAIIFYYLIAVVLESAQTGVPFGTRFASVYVPIRLSLAVFMLVPLPTPMSSTGVVGFNAAQYMVLWLAKTGSGFGTNGWNIFNNSFLMSSGSVTALPGYGPLNPGATAVKPAAALVALPQAAKIDPILQFMFIAHSCRAMYNRSENQQFFARDSSGDIIIPRQLLPVEPYIIAGDGAAMKLQSSTTYASALSFVKNSNLRIRFGVQSYGFGIAPFCGELLMRVDALQDVGASNLLENHFKMISQMWTDDAIIKFGERMAEMYLPDETKPGEICMITIPYPTAWGDDSSCGTGNAWMWMPKPDYYSTIRDPYQALLESHLNTARDAQITALSVNVDNKILNRGWAGAGIWYNRLAQMNGALFDATKTLPTIVRMPEPMEAVMNERKAGSQEITSSRRFTPASQTDRTISVVNLDIATGLNEVYKYLQGDGVQRADVTTKASNPIFDLMNNLFGTTPLFNMRSNADINPLVQMTALGKSIVDAAFFNILVGGGIEFTGGILQQLGGWQSKLGQGLNTLGDAWFTVAMIGLGIGIMLYYVIPFLPFIYFFFSVIKWVQSIFEAMIGVPIWALAHLRIDGDGIPTEAAEGGYFLLLEIVLRPILTVIGLICSFIIFTGMVYTLNDIFNLVMVNLTGYTPASTGTMGADIEIKRGTVDQFFYTVMYAVLVYIMAVGCFKLIDLIPANILRWIGSSAKNIIDETGDPVPGLIQSTYVGAFGLPLIGQSGMIGQAVKGIRQGVEGLGAATGQGLSSVLNKTKGP